MQHIVNLTHHFLIAMPSLENGLFQQSVIYLCEHNEKGAMGIIINRPLELRLADVYQQLGLSQQTTATAEASVYFGGPVTPDRGFILHPPAGHWQATFTPHASLNVTSSQDIIQAIAEDRGPPHFLVALGYAGWDSKQLEEEISANYWLTCAADLDVIFSCQASQRWKKAGSLLGIDLQQLSTRIGHA